MVCLCRCLVWLHIGVGSALFVLSWKAMREPVIEGQATVTDSTSSIYIPNQSQYGAFKGVMTAHDIILYVMKNFAILLALLLLGVTPVIAQTNQVATLSHDSQINLYYGYDALRQAYETSVDGDVITLSSGSFSSVTLYKNITIRGAGMMPNGTFTAIIGDVRFYSDATIEGVYFNDVVASAKKVTFSKCYFKGNAENTPESNVRYIHCIVGALLGYNAHCINTVIKNTGNLTRINFNNCYTKTLDNGNIKESTFNNCIVHDFNGPGAYFHSQTILNNCYYFGEATDPFRNSMTTTNVVDNTLVGESDVFKDLFTYELKDGLAAQWLGSDGTQVGVHGGSFPFDSTPTNPQITKFNVAKKTTADGMLSVDIEVKEN